MSSVQQPTAPAAVRDQSTGLVIFGIFQILLGCLCGLMGAMMAMLAMLGPLAKPTQGEAMNARMMIPAVVFYFLLGAGLICLGIGSIRARRWAWTLTVIVSWIWLIAGLTGFVVVVFVAGPLMSASIEQQGQAKMPPEALMVVWILVGAITFCLYVLLPAVFLVFYQRASVWATCQRRDPRRCWTDRCPMPVLVLSILIGVVAASSAVSLLSMPANAPVMPLFGRYVSGAGGASVAILIALASAYLAWGTYRLRMAAWWGTLLLCIAGTANGVITFLQTDLMEMYEKMEMPAAQLELMRKSGFAESVSRWGPWTALVIGALWLGYLLYVRRYFTRHAEAGPVGSQTPTGQDRSPQ